MEEQKQDQTKKKCYDLSFVDKTKYVLSYDQMYYQVLYNISNSALEPGPNFSFLYARKKLCMSFPRILPPVPAVTPRNVYSYSEQSQEIFYSPFETSIFDSLQDMFTKALLKRDFLMIQHCFDSLPASIAAFTLFKVSSDPSFYIDVRMAEVLKSLLQVSSIKLFESIFACCVNAVSCFLVSVFFITKSNGNKLCLSQDNAIKLLKRSMLETIIWIISYQDLFVISGMESDNFIVSLFKISIENRLWSSAKMFINNGINNGCSQQVFDFVDLNYKVLLDSGDLSLVNFCKDLVMQDSVKNFTLYNDFKTKVASYVKYKKDIEKLLKKNFGKTQDIIVSFLGKV